MISCVVVDDEPLAKDLICAYVNKIPDLKLVSSFSNGNKALSYLTKNTVQVVFLDIQMPEISGLEIVKILENKPFIVLTTAYAEFAVKGFEYEVLDYLLKPITFERFLLTVNRIRKELNSDTQSQAKNIFVKSGYKTVNVILSEVLYLESADDYTHIYLTDDKIKCSARMKDLVSELPENFVRVHRSYMVNKDKIDHIERNRIVINKKYIPIGSKYSESFFENL